jgi:hypothetical protein
LKDNLKIVQKNGSKIASRPHSNERACARITEMIACQEGLENNFTRNVTLMVHTFLALSRGLKSYFLCYNLIHFYIGDYNEIRHLMPCIH